MLISAPIDRQLESLPLLARELGHPTVSMRRVVDQSFGISGQVDTEEAARRGLLSRPSALSIPSFYQPEDSIDRRRPLVDTATANESPSDEAVIDFFDLSDAPQVLGFLRENTSLLPVLSRALAEIAKIFGPTRPILEFFQNPAEPADRKLFTLIRCSLLPEDALALLQRLDDQWWADAARYYGDRLALDVRAA
jgi:hypothetical protein